MSIYEIDGIDDMKFCNLGMNKTKCPNCGITLTASYHLRCEYCGYDSHKQKVEDELKEMREMREMMNTILEKLGV